MYTQNMNLAVRQAERWVRAAKQDRDPSIMFLHASYGVGVIDMIRQLWNDADILSSTGIDMLALHEEAAKLQDASSKVLQARMI